jgi:hypothetical protein
MAKPATPAQETIAKNTVRRAKFGTVTRRPEPERWDGVSK